MNSFVIRRKPLVSIPRPKRKLPASTTKLPKIPLQNKAKNTTKTTKSISISTACSKPSSQSSKKSDKIEEIPIFSKKAEFPQISWDEGKPNEDVWYLSVISWGIQYSTNFDQKALKVEVFPKCYILKNKSWVKYKYDELLRHEQGHFNIGFLCALSFKKKVDEFKFNLNNYNEELKRIFNENLREFCFFERKYDEETNHMIDKEMQIKWNEDLQNRLETLKKYL